MARDRLLGEGESHELLRHAGRLLRFKGRTADEVALFHLHEPAESGLERSDRLVDVIAVERHPHLETQRVAAAERDGGDAPVVHQRLPEPRRVLDVVVELEPVLSGVAGARECHWDPRDDGLGEPVVPDLVERLGRERLEDLLRRGPLHRQQADVITHIGEDTVELPDVLPDVLEILVLVRAVHDHHQVVVGVAVDEAIVHEGALLGENSGVMDLAGAERGDVVRRHVGDEVDRLPALDDELAHVAHVEHATTAPHHVVLGRDAARILDGHLEASERDHLGAGRPVHLVERGALERPGGALGHCRGPEWSGVGVPCNMPKRQTSRYY